LPFNASTITFTRGTQTAVHVLEMDKKLFTGTSNYISSGNTLTLADRGHAWCKYPFPQVAQVGLSASITTGVLSVSNITIIYDAGSLANWTASAPSGTATFTLSGLEYGRVWYNVYVDGDRIDQLKATETGIISFSYSGPWSQHTFKVDLYDPWGPLYDMGPWMLTIGFVVGMSAIVVTAVLSRVGRGRG
jgi:hypothetical protein